MIYISLKELIDDILLIVRNNNISESEDLSRDQIAVWIKAYKQKLIQDRLDRQKSGVADADLIDEDIDDIFIREKGPYELEDVQPIGNNPIYTRRTKLKFENIFCALNEKSLSETRLIAGNPEMEISSQA